MSKALGTNEDSGGISTTVKNTVIHDATPESFLM